MYKAVEGPSTKPIVLDYHLVMLLTSNAFNYFRARRNEIGCALDAPKFID